jgi:dihydrofolate reductase
MEQGSRHVYLDGGQTVRQGLSEGLVDQLTLSWVPIILGEGIPLFSGIRHQSAWQAGETRLLPSGLIQAVYRSPLPKAGHCDSGAAS